METLESCKLLFSVWQEGEFETISIILLQLLRVWGPLLSVEISRFYWSIDKLVNRLIVKRAPPREFTLKYPISQLLSAETIITVIKQQNAYSMFGAGGNNVNKRLREFKTKICSKIWNSQPTWPQSILINKY